MRRRILTATLAVTVVALVVVGVPLAWSVGRMYRSQQLTRLQQAATLAAAAVPAEGLHGPDPVEAPVVGAGIQLSYYDTRGALVAGSGPAMTDAHTKVALEGRPSEGSAGTRLVVAVPISASETTVGAVEASSGGSSTAARTARAWTAIAVLAMVALGVAALIAVWQARRLARPVDGLVAAANRLGDGDFALSAPTCGISGLDQAGAALATTARRLGELVNRERAFTAHASHQMRTPLTALRLDLENALGTPGVDPRTAVSDAISQVDRLEETLAELYTLARTGAVAGPRVPLGGILAPLEQRWRPVLAGQGRRLNVLIDEPTAQQAAPASLAQILEVLVENANTHGEGTVEVAARTGPGLVSVEVTDEGGGMLRLPEPSYRAQPGGHGLGLPLARSIAIAAGGALVLKHPGPHPVIAVIVPDVAPSPPVRSQSYAG